MPRLRRVDTPRYHAVRADGGILFSGACASLRWVGRSDRGGDCSMTTAVEVLQDLHAKQIDLAVEGENLRYDAPEGAVTDDVVDALRQHKTELLVLLTSGTPPRPGRVGRHQAPCPDCGETWYWPTTHNGWACSGCVVAGKIPTGE